MLRIVTLTFVLALSTQAADPRTGDSRVTFVPKQQRVSVRELQISDKAKGKYAEAEKRLRKGDIPGARRSLQEALAHAPDYSAAWNALGVIAPDIASAEANFRRALETDSDNLDAAMNLGGVLLKTGRPQEALPLNERVANWLPADAVAQAQLGMNLYKLDNVADAERHLLAAKTLNPTLDSMPQLFLAEIYTRRGEKARAAAEIEEVLTLAPNPQLAATLRGVLARLK